MNEKRAMTMKQARESGLLSESAYLPPCAYSTETVHSDQSKLDSRSVATRELFFTPDLRV